jgi:hypothetical protein
MFGFNFFPMLVVDIMHEFELGVWKALFIHLLRILDCIDPGLIIEMNRRYDYLTFYFTLDLLIMTVFKLPGNANLW